MRFVHDDRTRAARLGAKLLQLAEQSGEEQRAVRQRKSQQIDDQRRFGIVQHLKNFRDIRRLLRAAERDDVFQMRIIALGIKQANLEISLREPLEQPDHGGGFSAARRPGDYQTGVAGIDGNLRAIRRSSEENRLAHQAVSHPPKVIQQQPINNFLDSPAVGSAGDMVSPLSQGWNGVGYGDAALAGAEQGVVIFGVADGDGVVMGDAHFGKRGEQAGALIDAGGQNHDRALVIDDLKFQSEFANDGENLGVLG